MKMMTTIVLATINNAAASQLDLTKKVYLKMDMFGLYETPS